MTAKIETSLFNQNKHNEVNKARCPDCGGAVVIKQSKHGAFKSCENYPRCDFSQSLQPNGGQIIKTLGVECPECSAPLVLRQGRFGMFIGCSAYPACHHIEKRETHNEQADSIPCPNCKKGNMVERQSRFGKRFYACDSYPACQFAVNLPPVAGECPACHFPLLLEKKVATEKTLICANKHCQQQIS